MYDIMQALDNLPTKYSDCYSKVDDNILHQLQKMFVFLEYSTRGEYTPLEFIYSFKDYDGKLQNKHSTRLSRIFDETFR
jgi:hypothetical protein